MTVEIRIIVLLVFSLLPQAVCARPSSKLDDRISAALLNQTTQRLGTGLMTPDAYGTPLIIKLARQGDTQTLQQLTNNVSSGEFLLAQDTYGNNIFHVAKNAATIHILSSLVRRFYGANAPKMIAEMMNTRNRLGETPLHAQVNAGHDDTFRPIYNHTSLKAKNEAANMRLTRLQGADESIVAQNKAIYLIYMC